MTFPMLLLDRRTQVYPLFGDALTGPPHLFDFLSGNPPAAEYDVSEI